MGFLIYLWTQVPAGVALAVYAGILVCLASAALLRYWFFRFRLGADGVLIRSGVFRKSELDVQFDRIQGVHVEQSLSFRLLGLVTVSFDTAGSNEPEGHLPAVTPRFADSLRARIEGRGPRRNTNPEAAASAAAVSAPAVHGEGALLYLGNSDMVRIGLTDRSAFAVLAFLPLVYQSYREAINASAAQFFDAASAEFAQLGLLTGSLIAVGLLFAGVSLALTVTIISAFLRYHGFTLLQEGSALRSRSGLLTRKQTVVEIGKIQQLTLAQGVVMRWLGRYRLRVLPATSGPSSSENTGQPVAQRLVVPLLDAEAVRDLRARMLPGEGEGLSLLPAQDPFTAVSPHFIRARLLATGVVPALAAAVVLLPLLGSASLWCLAWIGPAAAIAWQRWRRCGYRHDDHGLSSRSGLLGCRVHAFLLRKAQGVTVTRSPLQRRKGLANLTIHLASGAVTVPYIDHRTACRLRDSILYRAESSRLAWH